MQQVHVSLSKATPFENEGRAEEWPQSRFPANARAHRDQAWMDGNCVDAPGKRG
jgi:hypothetical protein